MTRTRIETAYQETLSFLQEKQEKVALREQNLTVSEIFHGVEKDILRLIRKLSRNTEGLSPEHMDVLQEIADRSKEDPDWMRGLAAQFILATLDRHRHLMALERGDTVEIAEKEESPKEPEPEPEPEPEKEEEESKEEPETEPGPSLEEVEQSLSGPKDEEVYEEVDKAVEKDIKNLTEASIDDDVDGSSMDYIRTRLSNLRGLPPNRIAKLIKHTM